MDGLAFASRKEAARWVALRAMEDAGEIAGLKRQVRFPLEVNGARVAVYIADFCYTRDGERVVEDTKAFPTPVYKLKKRIMKACWDIDIYES